MAGPEREVGEERTIGRRADVIAREGDGVIDEIFGDVVAVLGRGRWIDVVVVVDELWAELVGLSLQEAVEAVEALRQRPIVERARRPGLVHRRKVPLADHVRAETLCAQNFCKSRSRAWDGAAHVGEARVEVRDGSHPDGVMVAAGEHRRPSRRAQRGGVEVHKADATVRKPIEVRRRDGRPVAAEVGEADVVDSDSVRPMTPSNGASFISSSPCRATAPPGRMERS